MLIKLIRRLLYKAYVIGKFEADKIAILERKNEINLKAIVGSTSKLSKDSLIFNETGDNQRIRIGDGCLIRGDLLVYNHGGKIIIGNDCFIGPGTRIWSASLISIGNRVLISHGVNIHDNNSHPLHSVDRHKDFKEIFENGLNKTANYNEKPVVIEDDVWIGFNSIIMKGVKIGRGAIVGAGSMVTKDVEPYSVMIGNPARCIKLTD
jgi:acetyltransferase-like isoleucine patch superfamily enzyme